MKKILLTGLLCGCLAFTAGAQEALFKIAGNYFRSDPFGREFSQFLNHLINDPGLTEKIIHKKNDTALFYLEGIYTSHTPFFFKATRTKIILAEKEEVIKADSVSMVQSIFLYQLIGYAPAGKEGAVEVQAEFEKFTRRYKKSFTRDDFREFIREGQPSGAIRNFVLKQLDFYPLTAAWASSRDQQENIFAITLRFRVAENRAYLPLAAFLPVAPDGF